MATLKNIFDKCGVALYQNESLDLDHYYQEPYQDEGDEIKVIGEPFETDKSKRIRPYDLFAEDRTFSNFSFFMDGCNGVQREHNKKLNNGLPILHKVPPKRDYGRYFCIMAEKGGTSHGA